MKLGFFSLLTLIFVVMKLLEVITWSWWLVFSPLLIGFVLAVLLAVFIVGLDNK